MAIVTGVRWYLIVVWHWFNNYWCGVSFLVLLLFYALWVQFTSWNWLLQTWPYMEFFSHYLPQDISWEVSFTALSDLWLLRPLQHLFYGFPAGSVVKNAPAMQETCRRHGFNPWVRKIPWSRKWQPTPVFLPGKSRGQSSLMGYRPWGHKELETTEWLNNSSSTCSKVYILIWTS